MRIYLTLLFVFCLSPLLHAQGLPSLMAVETPNFSAGTLPDPTFPKALEKSGDLQSALLEWKRIEHTATLNGDIERASFNIARIEFLRGKKDASAIQFEHFIKEYPKSKLIPEALYYMSRVWDDIEAPDGGKVYRAQLLADYPKNEWMEKAYYHYLWKRTLQGDNIESFEHLPSIPSARGVELAERLKDYPTGITNDVWMVTGMSLIPGLGHAYLGDLDGAFFTFIVGIIMLSAMLYAMKYRLTSFTLFFAIFALTFYAGSIVSAHNMSLSAQKETRINAMKSWGNLHPEYDWVSSLPKRDNTDTLALILTSIDSAIRGFKVPNI